MMKKMEDVLAAATFAEEGEAETARSLLREGRRVLLALKEGRIDAQDPEVRLEHVQKDQRPPRHPVC